MATAKDTAEQTATDLETQLLDETPGLQDIAAAFADVPDDSKVTLYRRQKDSSKWGVLGTMAPDMFSVDGTAEKWGSGTYRAVATARVKGKTGRPRVASVQFVVDPAIDRSRANGEAPPASSGGKLAEVLEASYVQALSSMMQTMQATAEAARAPAPPATDWPAIAVAASPIIVALLEKRSDPLATAAKLVELTRPEGKAPEFSTMFDVFSQGLEFASDQKPDSLGRIAETVTQLVERTTSQTQEEAPKMLPGDTQAPPQVPPNAAGPPWLQALRPFFPYLIRMGSAGKNPLLYAEWLVDQLPPEHVPAIVDLVADPLFPENVVGVLPPQVAPLADWFRSLCLEVARILEVVATTATPPPETPEASGPTFARPPLAAHEASGGYVRTEPATEEGTAEDED